MQFDVQINVAVEAKDHREAKKKARALYKQARESGAKRKTRGSSRNYDVIVNRYAWFALPMSERNRLFAAGRITVNS